MGNRFIGNYQYSIDQKGRVIVPSKFRNQLGSAIIVSLGFDKTLEIRTPSEFENWTETLLSRSSMKRDIRAIQRGIFGNSHEISIDKQGRILLPKNLIDSISIKENVHFIGMGNRIEIISSETWKEFSNGHLNGVLEEAAEKLDD